MREILAGREGVQIDRPTKIVEIRVRGLECSILKKEVTEVVAEKRACCPQDIQTREICRDLKDQVSLWFKLPLIAAKKAGGIHLLD